MQSLFFLIIALIFGSNLQAQTVNGIPLQDIDVEYVQIIGTQKLLSTKLFIQIDFGQNVQIFSLGKETILKDAEGKSIEFNSMIDALNFMSKNGYDFVTAYTITLDGNRNVYHYLLRNNKIKSE